MKIVTFPAFPPERKPKPSSEMSCSLDFAICRENLDILIEKRKNKLSGEIFSGLTVLNPSLIKGVRKGIETLDKKTYFHEKSSSLRLLIEELSHKYSSSRNITSIVPGINYSEWEKFLLEREGARIFVGPSTTYNHYGTQGINEVWVGGDVETFYGSHTGLISPNIKEFFRQASVGLL